LKRKIAAILAADIAGYSRLIAEDEEETLRRLTNYQQGFKDIIIEAGGRIFKTAGDSVLAEFPSAVDALRCAINVQESLRIKNNAYPLSRQMAYRMGLTIGDVVDQDGDLLGDGVNIAARLESLAQPGGICISKSMHDAVNSKLSVTYVDMGSHQVKNIPIPIHVFAVSSDARQPESRTASVATFDTESGVPAGKKSAARSKSFDWRQPPLGLTALAVALLSALAVTVWQQWPQRTPVQVTKAAPPAASKSTPSTENAAVTPPASIPQADEPAAIEGTKPLAGASTSVADVPPANSAPVPPPVSGGTAEVPPPAPVAANEPVPGSSDSDTAAAQRRHAANWNACNGDDTEAALRGCKGLIAAQSLSGEGLATAQSRLGYALRKTGDLDGAIASLSQSITTSPKASAYNDRGIAHLLKGEFEPALADYSEAIKLDGKNGDALNNRAWTYYKTSQNQKALADADKAVSLIGDKAYVWDTRGHIHEALGDRKAAEADFVKALSLDGELSSSRDALKRLTGR
jgi:class 3 adenylate cyclase/Flp pilus assembly protein TadD